MAPYELDVFIVHVKDQNPTDMATLWVWMDTFFEYKQTPCTKRGLKMLSGDFWKVRGLNLNIYSFIKPNGFPPWDKAKLVEPAYEIQDKWKNSH
jgi:hypothetical protein